MSGTCAISTTSRRELSSSFVPLQGKAPKGIHAILTEALACSLPGRAKDLSATVYNFRSRADSVEYLFLNSIFSGKLQRKGPECNLIFIGPGIIVITEK